MFASGLCCVGEYTYLSAIDMRENVTRDALFAVGECLIGTVVGEDDGCVF